MSQLQDNLNEILRQKNLYLLPENIRKDLTILGVTGTFEGGSSEGIKLFNTIEEMNSSTGNVDGDLAVVYNQTTNNYEGVFEFENNVWNIALTGLSATSSYVVSNIFQGSNGVETGTLQSNTNVSLDDLKIKSQVYSDLSTLEFSDNVTNLTNAFRDNPNYVNVPSIIANNVTECTSAFKNDINLISVGKINFPNCSNYQSMFQDCFNLKILPINSENVKNDAIYTFIFQNCYNLHDNIYNINITNCNLASAFHNCGITKINNLTAINCNFHNTFYGCNDLMSIENMVINCNDDNNLLFSTFNSCRNLTDISNVTFAGNVRLICIFQGCYNLVNISNLNIDTAKQINAMFWRCNNLTTIPNLNTSNVTSMASTFQYCYNLVDVPQLNMSNVIDAHNMFLDCDNLSNNSYANIANSLPLANNLTNYYISNIGLNVSKFDYDQLVILNSKGYIDAIPIPPSPEKLTYYNIYYNTNDEVVDGGGEI